MEPETRNIANKREEQLEGVRQLESQHIYDSKTTENVKNLLGLNSSLVLLQTASCLKIFDTASRSILLDVANKGNDLIVEHLPTLNRLAVARGNYLATIAPTDKENPSIFNLDKCLLKDECLKTNTSVEIDNNNQVKISLTYVQAFHLTKAIKHLGETGTQLTEVMLQDLKSIDTQLSQQIQTQKLSNRQLQWLSCHFALPFKNLKDLFTKIIDTNTFHQYEATQIVLQSLEYLRRSANIIDPELAATVHNNMNSEVCRLATFKNHPKSINELATPSAFAAAGMYMKPTQYEDETICYKCMFEFAGWDNLGAPWEEHLSQNPNCPFITESDPNNVDLSTSLNAQSFVKGPGSDLNGVTKIVYLENSFCVGTMSKEGIVTIWDVLSLVKVSCYFNPLEGIEGSLHTIQLLPTSQSVDEKVGCNVLSVVHRSGVSCLYLHEPLLGGGSKVIQTIERKGLVTEAHYIPHLKKLMVTLLLENTNTMIFYSYDEETCKLEETSSFKLDIDSVSQLRVHKFDSELVTFAHSRSRNLSVIYSNREIFNFQNVNDFTFLENSKTLVTCHNDQVTVTNIFEKKKQSQDIDQSESISLSNLQPLKYVELERLSFSVCSPVSMDTHNDGGNISWDIGQFQEPGPFVWEIEFSQESMVDSLEFSFGFSDKDKEIDNYLISVEYLDEKTGKMVQVYDKLDVKEKLDKSSEVMCSLSEEEFSGRKVSLTGLWTARYLTVTMDMPSNEEGKKRSLEALGLTIFGNSQNIENALTKRKKRKSLLESIQFVHNLLEATQQDSTSPSLKNLCFELLWTGMSFMSRDTLSQLPKHISLEAFIISNIVRGSSVTAKWAGKILSKFLTEEPDPELQKKTLQVCLSLLPTIADVVHSSSGLTEFMNLLSHSWTADSVEAYNASVSALRHLGSSLYANRSPLYNVLRTHYDLDEFPLELGIFKGHNDTISDHEELSAVTVTNSTHCSYDIKAKKIKIRDLHRKTNWVTLDLGAPCLLTDLVVGWTSENYAIVANIETWLETGDTPTKLVYKKSPAKISANTAGDVPAQVTAKVSCVCRYVKISINAATAAYGSFNAYANLYGIHDYISPSLAKDEILIKLNSSIDSTRRKLNQSHQIFDSKRRELTTQLEELNSLGSDLSMYKAKVQSSYDECMEVKVSYNKYKKKLRKLVQLREDVLGEKVGKEVFPEKCEMERWVASSLALAGILAKQKEFTNMESDVVKEMFRNFCVFGTKALRKQWSGLLSLQLDSWDDFASDVLENYFSSRSIRATSNIDLFPQHEVYETVKEMIFSYKGNRWHFVNSLFEIIDKFNTKPSDLSLISWVLLLLSDVVLNLNNVENQVVHPGTRCSNCLRTPITGVRYKCANCASYDLCEQCENEREKVKHNELHLFVKINTPLPLYPSAALPTGSATPKDNIPALLPVFYKPGDATNFQFSKATIHYGVSCDGCGKKPITGIRFKCIHCDEYNLCSDCEPKVDHYPLHLFLRVYLPLSQTSYVEVGKLPKALISNTDFVPLLLHHSSPATPKRNRKEPEENAKFLYSLFTLIAGEGLQREVVLLAVQLLEMLAKQSVAEEVYSEVIKHPNFRQFLQRYSSHADPFLRNAGIALIEILCNDSTYKKPDTATLRNARTYLRDTCLHLLSKKPSEMTCTFLIEILLIVSPAKDMTEMMTPRTERRSMSWRRTSAPPVMIRIKEQIAVATHPLHELAPLLLGFLSTNPLTVQSARAWCMSFRLLQMSEVDQLTKSNQLPGIIKSPVMAIPEVQIALKQDFSALLTKLQSTEIQLELVQILVETVDISVKSEQEPILFISLANALTSNLKLDTIQVETLLSLLQKISLALPDIQKVTVTKIDLYKLLFQLFNSLITSPAALVQLPKLLPQSEHSCKKLLDWLSQFTETTTIPASTLKKLKTLQDEVIKVIKSLSVLEIGGKNFLKMCLGILRSQDSAIIAKLTQDLITSEDLAKYVVIEEKGYDLVLSQITQTSRILSPSQASVTAAIQKHMKSKSPKAAKTSSTLENLSFLCEVVGSTDTILSNVVNSESGSVYVYQYKENEEDYNLEISLSSDVIVKEMQLNIYISYSGSQLPTSLTVMSGTSANRLVTACHQSFVGVQKNNNNNVWKFTIGGSEVVRYLRLVFKRPKPTACIAIGRLLLRGHTLWNYSPSISSPISLSYTLLLLSHFTKFSSMQKHLAHHEQITMIGNCLLDRMTMQNYTSVQDILLSLCHYNAQLIESLLGKLLGENSQISTSFQAELIGRLCSFPGEASQKGIVMLQKYFFAQLQISKANSSLLPLLNAFTFAVAHTLSPLEISEENVMMLTEACVHCFEGGLMEEAFLKLMSSLIRLQPSIFGEILSHVQIPESLSNPRLIYIIGILATSCPSAARLLIDSGVPTQIIDLPPTDSHHDTLLLFLLHISYQPLFKSWFGERVFPTLLHGRHDIKSKSFTRTVQILANCCNMHDTNPEKVARYLLESVQESSSESITQQSSKASAVSVSEGDLQLFASMFAVEDTVSLCLSPIHGVQARSDELYGSGDNGPKVDVLNLNPELTHTSIEIDGRNATVTFRANFEWASSVGTLCMESGIHKWEVVIDNSKSSNIMIGVCDKKQSLLQFVGGDSQGWAYYAHNPGYKYHASSAEVYGDPYGAGDVIGVTLDMNAGSISFSKNGNDLGIAYSTGILGKKLYPAVSLLEPEDSVTFRNYINLSSKRDFGDSLFVMDSASPMRYHRVYPMLNCPVTVSLSQIEQEVGKGKSVAFRKEIQSSPLDNNLLVEHVITKNNESGIQDFAYQILPTDASSPTVPAISSHSQRIFHLFTSKGGLPKILSALYTTLESLEISTEKDFSPYKRWLIELSSFMQIQSFSALFVKNEECCNSLFRFIKGVTDISGEEMSKAVKEGVECMYKVLAQVMVQVENQIEIRKSVIDSDSLVLLLVKLGQLTSTQHRKPEKFENIELLAIKKKKTEKDKKKPTPNSSKRFWAKGTGYGTNNDANSDWNHADYMKEQQNKAKQSQLILQILANFLSFETTHFSSLFDILESSCLTPVLESYLRNDSIFDMGRQISLYRSVLSLVRNIVKHDTLLPLIDTLTDQSKSLVGLMEVLNSMATILVKGMDKVSGKKPPSETSPEIEDEANSVSEEDQLTLANDIIKTNTLLKTEVDMYRKLKNKEEEEDEDVKTDNKEENAQENYVKKMKSLQFGERQMTNSKGEYDHNYKSRITSDGSNMSSAKAKRLIQEVATLSTGLPLYLGSSVFMRVDEERIDIMQVLITGPTGTPYDNGCFLFDVYCPPEYPEGPPFVNLQTTGGGSVRFNPNLYNCGKVCLSLLGTWSGGTNEKWDPSTSTLLQVLVSIQSLILVDQPFFNEPGYESQMNTASGQKQSNEYNEVIRAATLKWAILEQLKNPSAGFEEVIKLHFKLKKEILLKQCAEWLKDAQVSRTTGFGKKIQGLVDEIKVELAKLDEEEEKKE